MSERVTLSIPTSSVQTRAFRSHSFNPPPPVQSSHRSRRTLSLPAREKPLIPPVISESDEYFRMVHEQYSGEEQPCSREICDDIGKSRNEAGIMQRDRVVSPERITIRLATSDWDLFLGSPEFNSSTTLVNRQLVCLLPVGFWTCYAWFGLFVCHYTPKWRSLGMI